MTIKPLFPSAKQVPPSEDNPPKRVAPLFPSEAYTPTTHVEELREKNNQLSSTTYRCPKCHSICNMNAGCTNCNWAVEDVIKPLFATSVPAARVDPKAPVVPVVLNLPGTKIRKRWEPTVDELVVFVPAGISPAEAIGRAKNMIRETNTDTETFSEWGYRFQQQVSACSNEMLSIATHPSIQRTVDEMQSLLKMTTHDSRWNRFSAGLASEYDTHTVLATASRLRSACDECETPRLHFEQLGAGLPTIEIDLQASSVAGRYLMTVIPQSAARDTLDKRLGSIAITLLNVGQMRLQVGLHLKTLTFRRQVVLDVLVNMVPMWLNNRGLKNKSLMDEINRKLKGAL